jgi:hypothetical protein
MRKKVVIRLAAALAVFFAVIPAARVFTQEALPRLAVLEFDPGADEPKPRQDAVTMRNLIESRIIASQKYWVLSPGETEAVMEGQRVRPEDPARDETIGRLRRHKVNYLVTGSLSKGDEGEYTVTLRIFDVSANAFFHSTEQSMSANTNGLYSGITVLADRFLADMPIAEVQGRRTYKIGDRGPGGGIVFFAANGSYMEISPVLGKGAWNEAVDMAKNHRGGGYSDWRLPSRIELNRVYQNLQKPGLINLGDAPYWSSTQTDAAYAWLQRFNDGYQLNNQKRLEGSVCAIRSF